MSSSEYSKPMTNDPACSYNTLCSYQGANSTMPPLKPGTTSGVYLTPNYSAIGYNALTHGTKSSCQQYVNINNAYGSGAGACSTSYTTRLCGGGCGNRK